MPNPIDTFPYPWHEPDAQELHATLCQIYPTPKGALFVAERAGLDPATLFPDQAVFFLWRDILTASATAAKTRALVQLVFDLNASNPRRPFLSALLESRPRVVDRELRDANNAPLFIKGSDAVSETEALLFLDDLTLAIGRMGWLIGVLQRLVSIAPAVCKMTVESVGAKQFGTAFRIAEDLLLTNWHVLLYFGPPTAITAEFGYDDDGMGGGLASMAVPCDVASVVTDRTDDWGVVRVSRPLPGSIPVLKLSEAVTPTRQAPAFVIQHPGGDRKRVAYVRNQVTDLDDRVVHYLSDTQSGSSGSPVLNDGGRLIALHHAGGTPQEVAGKPPLKKNEGIRIERVIAGLKAAGIPHP
jgi:hypothetical protein